MDQGSIGDFVVATRPIAGASSRQAVCVINTQWEFAMASAGQRRGSRSRDEDDKDRDDREPERHRGDGSSDEDEEYDNPGEHLEIERQRFSDGLQPTPELYALAREQWHRLPGVLAAPSMDPVTGEASRDTEPPGQAHPDEREPGQ
jgi:hypothetical protein